MRDILNKAPSRPIWRTWPISLMEYVLTFIMQVSLTIAWYTGWRGAFVSTIRRILGYATMASIVEAVGRLGRLTVTTTNFDVRTGDYPGRGEEQVSMWP